MSTPASPERLPAFARMLRQLRRAARLTQEELAERARVGVRTLRDLETGRAARPQRSTVELLASALELDQPTREAFEAAARGREPGARPGRVGTLAAPGLRPATELVGREPTISAVAELLDQASHVTLVGMAGVGKTALAIAIGHRAAARFPGGVGGLTVTEASDEAEILGSVLSALGVPRLELLADVDAQRRCLVVVDGVDRGFKPAVAALERLRVIASSVTVLATSRQPLGLAGEHEWPVAPLEVPPPGAEESEVFRAPAVELFLDRLRQVRRRPVGLDEAATLSALVRRLGGVPLVLEIAAARGRVLELEEMLARCLDTANEADPAGQSLRAAVLGSWDLLNPVEQRSLVRLSVLQWRWSVPMAEAVLEPAVDAIGLIDRLVSLGLVASRPDAREPRFWVLGAVRDVALDEARRDGTLLAARSHHATVIVRLASRYSDALASGDPAVVELAQRWLDYLVPDIEAAIEHARGQAGPIGPAVRQRGDERWAGTGSVSDEDVGRLQAGLARWRDRRGIDGSHSLGTGGMR